MISRPRSESLLNPLNPKTKVLAKTFIREGERLRAALSGKLPYFCDSIGVLRSGSNIPADFVSYCAELQFSHSFRSVIE